MSAVPLAALESQLLRIDSVQITGNTVEPAAKLLAFVPIDSVQTMSLDSAMSAVTPAEAKPNAADGYEAAISQSPTLDPVSGVTTIPITDTKIGDITISGSRPGDDMVIRIALRSQGSDTRINSTTSNAAPTEPASFDERSYLASERRWVGRRAA